MLHLYHVDPSKNFALKEYAHAKVQPTIKGGALNLTLSAGDTQGRSLLLGAPTKIVAQHRQPALVLAMPPMHVDWVIPAKSATATPAVLNLTAVPDSFYSSYQTVVTNQDQSSHQGTTSFSTSFTESISQKISFGVPDVASVSDSTKTSATQAWKNSVSKSTSQYTSTSFDASTQTGFDDQLWYNSERQNIYIYPAIGQFVCPEGKTNCSPAQKVPLNVMFSGPDMILQTSIGGSAVEWYQPVREPGNIFSYPWNYTQMQMLEPNIKLLTSKTPTRFFTDGSTRIQHTQWSQGGSKKVTTGSTQNYSWSRSVSISGDVGIPEAGGLGGGSKFSFSYNGSKSFSTLNSSTTTLGESTGIAVNKPGTFAYPSDYEYGIEPFIYGTKRVTGENQTVQLNTDIKTNGILRAEFTADPTAQIAGSWWGDTYKLPDVALNHPSRWLVQAVTDGTTGANCLPIDPTTTRAMDCATFNAPDPNNIWSSEFYWMKGLVITPAEANGEGPQIDMADAGDQILLEARVYNYSLADMPADSHVVVQFYGQPWDQSPPQPAGDAFLIDEVGLAPIPGFNSKSSGGTIPNWSIASTNKLNTAAYGDQYLVFWVMVWMQDVQDGQVNLVPEMPDHGLTSIPGPLKNVNDAAPFLQTYSNNIGLYKSLFYIAEPNAVPQNAHGSLTVEQVNVSTPRVLAGRKAIVSAQLRAHGAWLDHRSVVFYDGNPDKKGKPFDVEQISHIRAEGTHQVQVPFRSNTCGTHVLFLVAEPDGVIGKTNIEVTACP